MQILTYRCEGQIELRQDAGDGGREEAERRGGGGGYEGESVNGGAGTGSAVSGASRLRACLKTGCH